METRRILAFGFAVMAAFSLLGGVVLAHHGRAGYDSKDNGTTVKGTVTEFSWKNPHVSISWEAKDASGKPVLWTGEFSSPTTMLSEGLSRATFKAGDEVAVTLIPAKGGIPYGLVLKIVRPDGKVVLDLSERRGVVLQ